MRAAADQLGLVRQTFDARSREEIEPAFDAMVRAGTQAVTPVQGGLSFKHEPLFPNWQLRVVCRCWPIRGKPLSMVPSCLMQPTKSKCVVDRLFTPTKY